MRTFIDIEMRQYMLLMYNSIKDRCVDFGINYPSDKTSKEDMDLCVCGWAGLSAAAGGMGARVWGGGGRFGGIHGVNVALPFSHLM